MTQGLRALLAAGLMIGFYLLAAAVTGILVWISYWSLSILEGSGSIKIGIFGLIAAGMVLWSVFPRVDRFPPPGPRLDLEKEPRLFDVIKEVAHVTGQVMPSEVYLVPDFNAWVAQRGGVMGIGSRRVMGLGLPLMYTLGVDEFRAVLAHEFGHFHGGDTRLGPWVYKTRTTIARTVSALESDSSVGFMIIQAPFRAYGALFMRITQAVSRAQEYAADRLAVRVAGARHLAGGLRSIHAYAGAYAPFWQNEYAPLLSSGFLPSFGEGFRRFLATEDVKEAARRGLQSQLENPESDPLDTHPTLVRRLEAIREPAVAGLEAPPDTTVASLLEDVGSMERSLLAFLFGIEAVSRLSPLGWDDVGERFYLPLVERKAAAAATALHGVTPESLPEIARSFFVRKDTLLRAKPGETYFRDQGDAAIAYIGAALTFAALRAGGRIASRPCRPVLVRAGSEEIDFLTEFANLRSDAKDPDRWSRLVATTAIGGMDLGYLGEAPDAGDPAGAG